MKNDSKLGVSMVALAAALWGTIGFAQSFLSQEIPIYWVTTGRFLVASVFFLLAWSWNTKSADFTIKISWKNLLFIIIGALSITINNFCFFFGVRETGIAIGAVATVGSAPIWAGLLSMIFEKLRPSKGWWFGVLFAGVGVTWMAISQANSWFINTTGLVSCFTAGLCYAVFSLMITKLIQSFVSTQAMALCFTLAFVFAGISSSFLSHFPALAFKDICLLLYLGVFSTGLAFFLYSNALSKIAFNTAVALSLFDPVTSFLLAVLVIGEPLQLDSVFGLLLILFGLWLVMKNELTSSCKEKSI